MSKSAFRVARVPYPAPTLTNAGDVLRKLARGGYIVAHHTVNGKWPRYLLLLDGEALRVHGAVLLRLKSREQAAWQGTRFVITQAGRDVLAEAAQPGVLRRDNDA